MTHKSKSENFDEAVELIDIIPQIMTMLRNEYRKHRGTELTITHFRLLANIYASGKTNKELAEIIGLSAAAMSRCVQSLEKKGLLKKSPNKNDRREYEIILSAKGQKLFESIRSKVTISIANRINELTDSEKQSLKINLSILKKFMTF